MHVCKYTHMHVLTCARMHARMHACMYAHMHVLACARVHARMHACMYAHMHVCMYTHRPTGRGGGGGLGAAAPPQFEKIRGKIRARSVKESGKHI